jgi:hypothetical protein
MNIYKLILIPCKSNYGEGGGTFSKSKTCYPKDWLALKQNLWAIRHPAYVESSAHCPC